MNLPAGCLLQNGKYKIIRFIASGGFGCTYEAEHILLGKRVAIKEFFVEGFCNRDENTAYVTVGTQSKKPLVNKLKKKFLDEARSISSLSHPGIVTVTDVFEENGTAYFVMGYIQGESVGGMLKRTKKFGEEMAVRIINEVCDALSYVHEHNRLHLDIKPANIMIDNNGKAILIDFGASKQYDEESGENTSTMLGLTIGYAPLEQMGSNVRTFSAATDIYALGATLYKMLTGITPPNVSDLACGVASLPPMPQSVSPGVKNAVLEAMQIQKDRRPQTIAEFSSLLNSDYHAADPTVVSPVPTYREPKKAKNKLLPVVIISIAVAVVAISSVFIINGSKSDTSAAASDATETIVAAETVTAAEPVAVEGKEMVNSLGTKFSYTGDVIGDNLPTGKGKGVYKDGTYTGEYVDGLRQGEGEFHSKSGQSFKGTFDNDHYSKGVLHFDNKSYFDGTYKNDQPYDGDYYEDGQKVGKYTAGKIEWL